MASTADLISCSLEGVDVLIVNAGFGLYGAVEDISIDEARYQFEVNVFGPAMLTQLLLPAMRVKGLGVIVNITSMGGKGLYAAGGVVSCDQTCARRLVGLSET
jgi:short-subunit dehydrogenase